MLARVAAQPLRSPLVTGRPSGGRFESQAEDVFGSACVLRRETPVPRGSRGERRITSCRLEDSKIEAVIVSTARTPVGKAHRRAFNITHRPAPCGHHVKT